MKIAATETPGCSYKTTCRITPAFGLDKTERVGSGRVKIKVTD